MSKKIQMIKLKGGAEVLIDLKSATTCKGCGVKIWWAETRNKKMMPVNLVSLAEWESHFASCLKAKKFRKNNSGS